MAQQREGLRERTLNNENLAGPEPHLNGNNHTTPRVDVSPPLEKDFSHNGTRNHRYEASHMHLDASHDSMAALRKIRTAGSVSISPELFEKLYLEPKHKVSGDLRRTLGNPTPLALIGFLISLTPLSMDLMGWRGAGGNGAAGIGTYFFFGGLLMVLGSIGEWIIGNTFPFVVFGSFGAFWLGWAATLTPFYNAYGAYSTTDVAADGIDTVGFRSSFAFFFIAMAVMCFIYLICSLRTNFVFFMIFLTLVVGFSCLAGAYFETNNGNLERAHRLQVCAGAFTFCTSIFGWWIFSAIMLASLDFPFEIPVFDLSRVIKGASERNGGTSDSDV